MMGKVIISKGKTFEEAIKIGLNLMELTKDQVDIEIIQQENERFFGIFGIKPAIVRLIEKTIPKKTDADELLLNPKITNSQKEVDSQSAIRNREEEKKEIGIGINFGKVWVKGGQIFIKETSTHYPMITPSNGMSLYKNGELVKKTTVLTEKDQVKIELPNEWKDASWSISLDPMKMVATLKIEPGYRKSYSLVDQEPSSHIHLEIQLEEEIINYLQSTHVEQRMKELGIKTGIQRSEIERAMEATEPGEFIIAKGINSQKGEDGWLECIVDTDFEDSKLTLLDNGHIDYRKLITLQNVEKGQLLGIIHTPKPGRIGLSVTGETIKPETSKEMVIQVGRGIEIVDQGSKIVAVDSGRFYIKNKEVNTKVSVIPRLIHSTDVDLSSGNLSYQGDIEVKGNVNEGMLLEAIGDILIHGTIDRSTVSAGNRIIVCQNVFNSHLNAGKSHQLVEEIGILLGRLSVDLKSFALAVDQVYQSPVFKTSDIAKMGLSSLIRILLEKKFKTLPQQIKELSELISKGNKLQILNSEFEEIRSDLTNGFLKMIPTQFKKTEDIVTMVARIDKVHELTIASQEYDATIVIPYALNSEINCSGDISIVGKGCINSNVHSGGKVQIQGVVRGGVVYAAMGVDADETGTNGGAVTRICVPDGQTIKIKNALEGTIIQIGNQVHQFNSSEQNVVARVTKAGGLQLF